MKNTNTILDLKNKTKEWNKEFLPPLEGEDDITTFEVTTIRNKYSLWIRK